MGNALVGSGFNAANLATNAFFAGMSACNNSAGIGDTTEAHSARVQHVAGNYSNYGAFCGAAVTGRTLQIRKTGGNANGLLTFPGTTATSVYDNVSVDSYSATDTVDAKVTVSAGGISFIWAKAVFNASGGHATVHNGSATFSSTATAFSSIGGRIDNLPSAWATTESFAQCEMRTSGTLQFVWISVTTASTTTATVISRKNGVNGNINISLTANATGIFEDTSNSDNFVSGDLLCFQCSGQSAGLVMMNGISSWLNYNNQNNEVFAGFNFNPSVGTNAFMAICGSGTTSALTEAQTQLQHGFGGTSSNMRIQSLVNSQNGTNVFTYRINGANGNQHFTVPANGTGWFEDSTNTDTFGPTDNVAINYVGSGTSGAATFGVFMTTEKPFQFLPSGSNPGFGPISRWPISVVGGKVTIEFIGPDKFARPLSEPVRFKAGLAPHLQQFLAFNPRPFVPPPSGWMMPLSEPQRALPRNHAALYPHFNWQPAPSPFVATGWFMPLSEPVRFKPALHPSLQQFTTKDTNPTPIVVFKWFMPLSEPVRFKPALLTALQQFLAWEPRTLRTPDIFAQLKAVELKDLFTGSAKRFFTIQGGEIGIFDVVNPSGEIGLSEEPSPGTISIVGGSISVSER